MKNLQQTKKLSSQSIGIGDRVRQFIHDLSVDVWGIEKRVSQHAQEYFQKISKEESIPKDKLSFCLTHTYSVPVMSLYQSNMVYRSVKTSELLEFLGTSAMIPEKVEKQITSYFNTLSAQCKIPINEIVLRLSVKDHQVQLKFYRNAEFLSVIQIRELLNFFYP